MAHQRYDTRKKPDGTWTVYDIFTGWPVLLANRTPAAGLDVEEADDLLDLMNLKDALIRSTRRTKAARG